MELSIDIWAGRFGNNVIQLCNLILFCKKYNFKCVQKLDHPIINKFSIDFSTNNINTDYSYTKYLYIINNPNYNNTGFQFYDGEDSPNFCKSFYPFEISKQEIIHIYSNYILPNLKIKNALESLDNNTLVIHIRSGDAIYKPGYPMDNEVKTTHSNLNDYYNGKNLIVYILPSVRVYEQIIERYDKVIIVAENRLNWAINYLENKYPNKVSIQTGTLVEDIELILSAKNLMFSSIYNGTFAHILSYLSYNLQQAYIIECMERDYTQDYKYLNKRINILTLENYYNNYSFDYILNWKGVIKEVEYYP